MDSHQDLLQSEVRSFFTPATTNIDSSSKNPSIPKFDIFEPTAPQSKTIIVKCEKHENSETISEGNAPNSHNDLNGVYRLERLDSSVNPDVTAKLDRMAQKLGFHVPGKSNWTGNSPNSDCEDLQIDDAVLSDTEKPETTTDVTVQNSSTSKPPLKSAPKRSFFANIMKRLSSRPRAPTPVSKDDFKDKYANRSRATSADSRPLRIRRWFTKRLWWQKTPEQGEVEPSEGSMASAGAVLEGNFVSSVDNIGNTVNDSNFAIPKKPGNLPTSQSSHSGPSRGFTSLEQLPPFNGHSQGGITTVNKYPNGPSTVGPYSPSSQYKALTLPFSPNEETSYRPSFTVSFSQTSLLEDNKNRSTGVKQLGSHDGSFLSRQACGSEGTALHMTNGAPVLATSRLPSGYTPSYVSVSVAAFGYSGYNRTSLSSGNLDSSRSGKPTGLTLAERAAGISTPRCFVTPRKPPVSPQTSPYSVGDQHPNGNTPKSPLRVEVAESVDSRTQPDVEKDLDKTTPNAERLSGTRSISSRPSSKVLSQSPCPSPVGDVSESASGSVRLRRTRTRSQTGNSEDQEHWHRSSLIMLAVAHASPRGRFATSLVSPENSLILSHTDGEDPTLDAGVSRISNGIHEKRENFIQTDTGLRSLTHSYHESIREEPNEESKTSNSTIYSSTSPTTGRKTTQSDVIDGRYFLRITDEVQAEIVAQIERAETDLATTEMDEEVAGLLRTAVGKAKLLISEKFVQFRSLCQQNLDWIAAQKFGNADQTTTRPSGPDLVTLVSDLDGFWAMVMLQVDDVRALLAQVDQLRANGWKLDSVVEPTKQSAVTNDSRDSLKTPVPKLQSTARKPNSTVKSATRNRDDSTARAKARERLAMAKREMRARQMENMAHATQSRQSANGEDVFIIM